MLQPSFILSSPIYLNQQTQEVLAETIGLPRIIEALEANEWESASRLPEAQNDHEPLTSSSLPLEIYPSDEELDFADMDLEDRLGMIAPQLRNPLLRMLKEGGQTEEYAMGENAVGEEDVADLEILMTRMQAVREHSTSLPPTARKAFVARAVNDIMGPNRGEEA